MLHDDYSEILLSHELNKATLPVAIKENQILSHALECIYKISVCDGKCRRGDHIIEGLTGRGYNLASGAIVLCSIGYYDESLNLVRSLGEIVNLLAYFTQYPGDYEIWALSSKKSACEILVLRILEEKYIRRAQLRSQWMKIPTHICVKKSLTQHLRFRLVAILIADAIILQGIGRLMAKCMLCKH